MFGKMTVSVILVALSGLLLAGCTMGDQNLDMATHLGEPGVSKRSIGDLLFPLLGGLGDSGGGGGGPLMGLLGSLVNSNRMGAGVSGNGPSYGSIHDSELDNRASSSNSYDTSPGVNLDFNLGKIGDNFANGVRIGKAAAVAGGNLLRRLLQGANGFSQLTGDRGRPLRHPPPPPPPPPPYRDGPSYRSGPGPMNAKDPYSGPRPHNSRHQGDVRDSTNYGRDVSKEYRSAQGNEHQAYNGQPENRNTHRARYSSGKHARYQEANENGQRHQTDYPSAMPSEAQQYKDERQRPDQYKEERQRPGQYKEERLGPDQQKEGKQRSHQYKEERLGPDQYKEERQRPGQYKEERLGPDQHKEELQRPEHETRDYTHNSYYPMSDQTLPQQQSYSEEKQRSTRPNEANGKKGQGIRNSGQKKKSRQDSSHGDVRPRPSYPEAYAGSLPEYSNSNRGSQATPYQNSMSTVESVYPGSSSVFQQFYLQEDPSVYQHYFQGENILKNKNQEKSTNNYQEGTNHYQEITNPYQQSTNSYQPSTNSYQQSTNIYQEATAVPQIVDTELLTSDSKHSSKSDKASKEAEVVPIGILVSTSDSYVPTVNNAYYSTAANNQGYEYIPGYAIGESQVYKNVANVATDNAAVTGEGAIYGGNAAGFIIEPGYESVPSGYVSDAPTISAFGQL